MAVQNARIISDSIREYHRKMKASVEVPEENPKALKAEEQYCFPDPPKGNGKPNVTSESGAINSAQEQHPIQLLPEETVRRLPEPAANFDPSSQSAPVVAPIGEGLDDDDDRVRCSHVLFKDTSPPATGLAGPEKMRVPGSPASDSRGKQRTAAPRKRDHQRTLTPQDLSSASSSRRTRAL